MKKIVVNIPDDIYLRLKKMKEEGKIVSISSFVRHLIYVALGMYVQQAGATVVITRRATVEEEWRYIEPRPKTPEERGWISYDPAVREELMRQLKQKLEERRKKMLSAQLKKLLKKG